ncbi:MAG TPA: hypothetical protein VG013_39930 [Gemmataceae bacterium]|jgi:hypothetical protein|nr:hypothetical protein [Gemmataceae bacterium]
MRTTGIVIGGTAALAGLLGASLVAAEPPPGPARPAVQLLLGPGEGTATPHRTCCAHAGGGNVLVTQPANDTIATSMTGVVVAKSSPLDVGVASYTFELTQDFEVVFSDPKVRAARLLMEARVVGLLRSPNCCCASPGASAAVSIPADAAVRCGPQDLLALSLPARSASCGENLSVYNREGPASVLIAPGKYTLHEVFGIQATGGKWGCLCKGPSAEFAPEGALDARWVSPREPFHGANKNSFGFQVILKVVPADGLNVLDPVTSVPPNGVAVAAPKAP